MTDRSLLLAKALQLSANRLADELCAAVRAGDCIDFFQRFDREPDKDGLNLHRGAPHKIISLKAISLIDGISDIAYKGNISKG
jgi:hypothetical protein